MSEFHRLQITDVIDECKDTKTFLLEEEGRRRIFFPDPAQFSIFWLPGVSANPISYAYDDPLGITVRKISDDDKEEKGKSSFAHELFQRKPGDYVFARPPQGNRFSDFDELCDACIVAGGCGGAPLAFHVDCCDYRNVHVLLGAKTKDELLFEKRFRTALEGNGRLSVATNNGSNGVHGYVTDLIGQADIKKGETTFFICGPEAMMKKAADIAVSNGYADPEHVVILMERYMKCGDGLCGSCTCGGRLICKDGPVMTYAQLQGTEFGRARRGRSGAYEKI